MTQIYDLDDARGFEPKLVVRNELTDINKIFNRPRHELVLQDFYKPRTSGRSPYFETRGFTEDTLELFGVEDCNDKQSPMQSRSIIPIHFEGKEIGYIARSTSGVTNLVILTDNDSAGRESKIKIKREFGRLFKLIFPAMHSKDLGNLMVEKLQVDILSELKGLY